MEISAKGENKRTKYNHVAPIDLDTIPKEEREQALMEFAEGSVGLEKCLRAMWGNGIKTHACCAGNDKPYDVAYITLSSGYDFYSYLSDKLLDDELIKLEDSVIGQAIFIAGTYEHKEKAFLLLANDILSGKKDNSKKVKDKIGKEFPFSWIKESTAYYMKRRGFSEKEIEFEIRGLELNWIMEHGSEEEKDAISSEYMEHTKIINQRLVERYQRRNRGK